MPCSTFLSFRAKSRNLLLSVRAVIRDASTSLDMTKNGLRASNFSVFGDRRQTIHSGIGIYSLRRRDRRRRDWFVFGKPQVSGSHRFDLARDGSCYRRLQINFYALSIDLGLSLRVSSLFVIRRLCPTPILIDRRFTETPYTFQPRHPCRSGTRVACLALQPTRPPLQIRAHGTIENLSSQLALIQTDCAE